MNMDKMKNRIMEDGKVFGDLAVTCQTSQAPYTINHWQISTLDAQSKYNLVKQTIETPDFMALNRLMANDLINRRGKKLAALSKSNQCRRNSTNNKNHRQIISNQQNYIENPSAKQQKSYPLPIVRESHEEIVISSLVDQLLSDIYRYPRSECERSESESTISSFRPRSRHHNLQQTRLQLKCKDELSVVLETLQNHINQAGGLLIRQLRRRDFLRTKRDRQYDVITAHLQAHSNKRSMEVKE